VVDSSSNELCYLCGVRPASTKDHLFPEGLFPRPMPTNLPRRLPGCGQCNQGLSKDEELFRVFVACGEAHENEAGFRVWTERIRPDLRGRRRGLKRLIPDAGKEAGIFSSLGDFLGRASVLEVEPGPINRVLAKIVKGLYYSDTGKVLPPDVQILVEYGAQQPGRLVSAPLDEAIRGAKRVDVGNGVVTYWRNTAKDDPTASLTWLKFYEDKLFLVCTFRQDTLEFTP